MQRILAILERRNLLFATLILPISASTVALPLLLIEFLPDFYAIFISTLVVFTFVEIIPQTVCTGPGQIKIASFLAPVTKLIIIAESPIAYPVSIVIDYFAGERKRDRYQNEDLKNMIELLWQSTHAEAEPGAEPAAEPYANVALRRKLISGALDLRTLTADKVMKEYEDVAAVSITETLTEGFIKKLREDGYSRYPVYRGDKHHVIGILLVKKLIGLSRFDMTLEELKIKLRRPLVVPPKKPLVELLVEFRKGKSHIALVTEHCTEVQKFFVSDGEESKANNISMCSGGEDSLLSYMQPVTIQGIVTLEDVVEKALGGYGFFCGGGWLPGKANRAGHKK